eukprot:Skav229333  [mRNA]  locus=scaffold2917:106078:107118:- [translate_table: standard]
MTWHCGPCNVGNSDNAQQCRKCQMHWSKVWVQSKRKTSRSRPKSRSKKEKKERSVKAPKEDKESMPEQLSIFPQKVPWIVSTPHSRITTDKDADTLPLPPPPTLPLPPSTSSSSSAPLTNEESKVLAHLQGLKAYGLLNESLENQLEILEGKQQENLNSRALTHAHLNKFYKAKHQTTVLMDKIKDLDSEWKKFVEESKSRLQQHATMYHRRRAELVQQHESKLQELENLRAEVSSASQSLVNQSPGLEAVKEEMDTKEDLEDFSQRAMELGQRDNCIEVSDQELIEDAAMTESAEPTKEKQTHAPRPFRGAASPTKVAQNHLKEKPSKDRDKTRTKEAKETKQED